MASRFIESGIWWYECSKQFELHAVGLLFDMLSFHRGDVADCERRIQLASTVFGRIYSLSTRWKKISENRRIKLYRPFVKPCLTYNCATWCMTKALASEMDRCHRRQLRSLIGIRFLNRIIIEHRPVPARSGRAAVSHHREGTYADAETCTATVAGHPSAASHEWVLHSTATWVQEPAQIVAGRHPEPRRLSLHSAQATQRRMPWYLC